MQPATLNHLAANQAAPGHFSPQVELLEAVAPIGLDEFATHRPALLRFARRKVRDQDLAEDAVQDTLLAALSSAGSFKGQSAVRTWLIGILNHKIQDVFRRESRYQRVDVADADEGGSAEDSMDRLQQDGAFATQDTDPQWLLMQREMMLDLGREIEALPASLKEVFTLQALEDVSTAEVCDKLAISEANVWVRLHRARKRLSERLQPHLN
jgi:RNA polymerase sigma-70 factor, ECF subfamily